jgi:hypothetical protein
MDVTSNHLDVSVPEGYAAWRTDETEEEREARERDIREREGEVGEELSKRGEQFGHPVGKSVFNFNQVQCNPAGSLPNIL